MTVLEPVVRFLMEFEGKKVTLEQVTTGAERPRKPTLRVMDRLVREGCLEEIEDNKIAPRLGEFGKDRRNPTWRIVKRPLDHEFSPKAKRRTVRDRMWQLMRAKRRFTRGDLQRLGGISVASVEDYTKMLAHYGYLRVIGKDGHFNIYMLVKDIGTERPNLKEVAS